MQMRHYPGTDVSILSDLIDVLSKYRGAVDNQIVDTLSDTVKALSDLSSKIPDTSKLTKIATDISDFVNTLNGLSVSPPLTTPPLSPAPSSPSGGVLEVKLIEIDSTVQSYLDTLKGNGGSSGNSDLLGEYLNGRFGAEIRYSIVVNL
jgi:hypothetical protein